MNGSQAVADAALPKRAGKGRGDHERRGEQRRTSTTKGDQTDHQQPREAPAGGTHNEKQREKHRQAGHGKRKQTGQPRADRGEKGEATACVVRPRGLKSPTRCVATSASGEKGLTGSLMAHGHVRGWHGV